MSSKQAMVLWLGIGLLIFRGFSNGMPLNVLWMTISTPAWDSALTGSTPTASSTHSSSESGNTGSVVSV